MFRVSFESNDRSVSRERFEKQDAAKTGAEVGAIDYEPCIQVLCRTGASAVYLRWYLSD